jgi:hypothetical protein
LEALEQHCTSVTVLAPFRPREAPENARVARDCYWHIALPVAGQGQKLRNISARAAREVSVREEVWGNEHEALVRHYLQTRPLQPGTRAIFSALSRYAGVSDDGTGETVPGMSPENRDRGTVVLLAARRLDDSLAGFSIGDFSGLHTAFYMFAFRYDTAPPGTADLLLSVLIRRAEELGHSRMNLGLGINAGIRFFKKKRRAEPYLPYVETSWDLTPRAKGKNSAFSRCRTDCDAFDLFHPLRRRNNCFTTARAFNPKPEQL